MVKKSSKFCAVQITQSELSVERSCYLLLAFQSYSWLQLYSIQNQMESEAINSRAQTVSFNQKIAVVNPRFSKPEDFDNLISIIIETGINPFQITLTPSPPESTHNLSYQEDQNNDISEKILKYDRKSKSLCQLTKKFIQKFEGSNECNLILDKVTGEMNVQRRRIYDIINIMQSLNVVSKLRKNIYRWKGLSQAVKTIQNIGLSDSAGKYKKERSLQSLATQFLRVFTKSKEVLTLQKASNFMLTDQLEQGKKTKVRRLYDIVNVFKCLGLVKKVKIGGDKPGYLWLGCGHLIRIIKQKSARSIQNSILSDSQNQQQGLQSKSVKSTKSKKRGSAKRYTGQSQSSYSIYKEQKKMPEKNSNTANKKRKYKQAKIISQQSNEKQAKEACVNKDKKLIQSPFSTAHETNFFQTNSLNTVVIEEMLEERKEVCERRNNICVLSKPNQLRRVESTSESQSYFSQILRNLQSDGAQTIDELQRKFSKMMGLTMAQRHSDVCTQEQAESVIKSHMI